MKDAGKYINYNGTWIAKDFIAGNEFNHGFNCIIEPDVIVGDNVKIGHNVIIKSGSRIMSDVEIADNCFTTGICIIGNHVKVRSGSCISKSVILNDWVFIGAGIMSSHTKNIYHGRPQMVQRQLITNIGYGAIIGSVSNLTAGINIAPGSIVGYNSNVVKDLDQQHGIYLNKPNPWATLQGIIESSDPRYIPVPENYKSYEFDKELLALYLPHYV